MMPNAKANRIIIIAGMLLVLAVINGAIWQKERHLALGEIVYLELAPVDPRSLMQGDYMALNFAITGRIQATLNHESNFPNARNGHVVVRLDDQYIAHFLRLDDGSPIGDQERRLQYRLRNGHVRFATNAFFFQEGHAERYQPARYGQFRINDQGSPLLVALYDSELQPLGSLAR
ncbi:GDYXXLXY domain-containing protein [Vreelandella profundi]|uniref:GDYXXLXY domain-containing protein n=1 Tax=Vreelandella profundi TaxID=2852117 RepID=UPI001EF051D8|nr:GDYXXLXY domain-containing protein [Halomonas profundi]